MGQYLLELLPNRVRRNYRGGVDAGDYGVPKPGILEPALAVSQAKALRAINVFCAEFYHALL
jgi:hypothetical protein